MAVRKKELNEKENKSPSKSRAAEPKLKKKKTEEKLIEKKPAQLYAEKKAELHPAPEKKETPLHTEHKAAERTGNEHKNIEHKPAGHKDAEKKPIENKKTEHKQIEHKPAEHKPGEHKIIESKSVEHKPIEYKAHEQKNHAVPAQESQQLPQKKPKEIIQPEINIGMIGHVDHGKTSLTKALTGKWCDTHSEEMKRGISIRLGYADIAFYKLKTDSGVHYNNKPEYGGKPAEVLGKRFVSFVDAPGHETLMTTMLSGAALMNGAVLVIAANEPCPQPRTIEHLMALKFAGVNKVVVAQNKVDLVEKEKALENYKAIREFMDSYGYKDAPIIPTAANFGANIDSLIEAIETHIPIPHFDTTKPLKMFVARSFDINKPGTKTKELKGAIIGGSIAQGLVKVGDEIELFPGLAGKTKTKVLSIATDQGLIQQAKPGGLIAIGTDLDPSMAQNDRLRGQIAAATGTALAPVKEITVKLNMFERMIEQNFKDNAKGNLMQKNNGAPDSSRKILIKVTEPLVITIGTNTVVGFVTKCDGKTMSANLKNEIVAEKGEKIAVSKNINGQWRLIAYGEVL